MSTLTRRAALVGAAASSIALAFPMAASLAKASAPLAAAAVDDMSLRIVFANEILRWLHLSTRAERAAIAAEWRTTRPHLRELADFVENWRGGR